MELERSDANILSNMLFSCGDPRCHSSMHLRYSIFICHSPGVLQDARWVPTDVAAQAVRDMLLAPDDTPLVVRHIQNAHVLDGKTLVTWLLDASGGRLKTTSFDAWLQRIQSAGDDVPAKRLLDVFEDWHEKGTDHCRRSLYRPLSLKSTLTASALAAGFPLTKKLITLYWKSSTDSLSSI